MKKELKIVLLIILILTLTANAIYALGNDIYACWLISGICVFAIVNILTIKTKP